MMSFKKIGYFFHTWFHGGDNDYVIPINLHHFGYSRYALGYNIFINKKTRRILVVTNRDPPVIDKRAYGHITELDLLS